MKGIDDKTLDFYSVQANEFNNEHPKVDLDVIPHFDQLTRMIRSDSKILFVGFGNGAEIDFFYQKGFKDVTGIEVSLGMIRLAKNLYPYLEGKLHNGDILDSPDFLESYDLVVYNACLVHLMSRESLDEVLKITSTILNENGLVYIRVLSKKYNGDFIKSDIDLEGRSFLYFESEELTSKLNQMDFDVEYDLQFNHERYDEFLKDNIEVVWLTLIVRKRMV